MPQLQAFIDTCHKIICDFIRGRGHKVPDKHVSAHMGKLGLKKLCEALESKYKGHAPRMELVEAFGVLDVNGDGLIEQQELRQVMEQCKFGGPKLKGLKVSRTEALSLAACLHPRSDQAVPAQLAGLCMQATKKEGYVDLQKFGMLMMGGNAAQQMLKK